MDGCVLHFSGAGCLFRARKSASNRLVMESAIVAVLIFVALFHDGHRHLSIGCLADDVLSIAATRSQSVDRAIC